MLPKVSVFLNGVSQLVVGIFVKETDTHMIVRNPALFGITPGDDNNTRISFYPYDLLNLDKKPIRLVHCMKNPEKIEMQFAKASMLMCDVEVHDEIINGYLKTQMPQQPDASQLKLF